MRQRQRMSSSRDSASGAKARLVCRIYGGTEVPPYQDGGCGGTEVLSYQKGTYGCVAHSIISLVREL
jgi:hypothetical protein